MFFFLTMFSAEQLYTPLPADKVRASVSWEGVGEALQVDVQWCSDDSSNPQLHGYLVVIGTDSCSTPNRSPPCFLVRNLVSLGLENNIYLCMK